jgi:hypothetical protein
MTVQEQMRKGTTTVIILNLLAELDRPMYGYEIIQELEARSEFARSGRARRVAAAASSTPSPTRVAVNGKKSCRVGRRLPKM